MAAGVVFGELDRPFDRVASARSTEYDLAVSAKTVRCDVVKPFDEFDSCLGREVNRMSDFIELLVDSLKHVRVGVSDVQHADSGEKVEECVPVDVPDGCTFGLLDRNRYATRVSDGVAVDLSLPGQQLFRSWSGDRVHVWLHRKVDLVDRWGCYHVSRHS